MGGAVMILTLPRLGETMEEARVTDWLKQPGEAFRRGDVLLEVETDKTVVEVPALQDGTLVTQLVAPGDTVQLDAPIAEVRVEGVVAEPARAAAVAAPVPAAAPLPRPAAARGDRVAASPLARRMARQAGVSLDGLAGSGRRGRIMGADLRALAPAANGPVAMRWVPAVGAARTPVVLLHGLFDEGRGWRDLPDRLAGLGHPVLVADLPGHGASAPAADLDQAVEALLAALPQGPLRLVGHSLGAVLATRLALRLGAGVERLVLISPAGLGTRINADFLDGMTGAQTPAALGRAVALLGGGPMSEAGLAAELARLIRQRPASTALARAVACDGIQQVDIAADLARLAVPVTAVFGLADRILDWRDCANLPARAAIHLMRGAGHLPQSHDPALVAALIAGTDRQGEVPPIHR
jgi:pimeloyl-ACP methyl ester carboxylesterase